MKTLTISTNNQKSWDKLLAFLEKHSLEFETDIQNTISTTDNFVKYLYQNPLGMDEKPLSREEIYD